MQRLKYRVHRRQARTCLVLELALSALATVITYNPGGKGKDLNSRLGAAPCRATPLRAHRRGPLPTPISSFLRYHSMLTFQHTNNANAQHVALGLLAQTLFSTIRQSGPFERPAPPLLRTAACMDKGLSTCLTLEPIVGHQLLCEGL